MKRLTPFVPLLLPAESDQKIFIYDFEISPGNCAGMSRTAGEVLETFSVPEKTRMFAEIFIEDVLMLVREKNAHKEDLKAECTIIAETGGVRLILRDSGVIFDVTQEDALPDPLRQYVVANMMQKQEHKAYLITTGYNLNEMFFPGQASS